ncbi:MAG: inositol monophosphatase [Haloferacaceae archaeon]
MERTATDRLADVAVRAARAGGEYLAAEFRNGRVDGDYGPTDVKAVADRESEARVREVVESAFPDHAFHGEEVGRLDGERYRWVVDPLDGTNNFASGLPSFSTAVAVLDETGGDPVPVVSAIYEPLPETLYLARRGEGATVNGDPLSTESDRDLAHGTVSFVPGGEAVSDPDLRAASWDVQAALRDRCKRVLNTWSPTVDWGLLARGSIEGLVEFHPPSFEHHAGSLLAEESGVATLAGDDVFVAAPDPDVASSLLEAVDGIRTDRS